MADTVENKGLAMVMDGIYAEAKSGLFPWDSAHINPGGSWGGGGLLPDKPIGSGFDLEKKVGPLLNASVRSWGQSGNTSPFNNLCPSIGGIKTPVGCTALACGMIMSYYQWPTQYLNYNIDWNDIIIFGGKSSYLQRLLFELGANRNLDMNYALDGSGADIVKHGERTFRNFGYYDTGDFKDYNSINISSVMGGNLPNPVIIVGYSDKIAMLGSLMECCDIK